MDAARAGVQAWLFDLDGTLIDSMPLHHEAWRAWHAQLGLDFDEAGFFEATAGRTNDEILADAFPTRDAGERAQMAELKESLYRRLATERLQLIRGARELLVGARAAGIRLAICTASPPANLQVAFDRFALGALVDTVTSPADGLRGKPHPDIFIEAARRLQVPAGRCLVFEDAPLGIEAARRAGMRAFALTTTLPASAFAGFPHLIGTADDLADRSVDHLLRETAHA